MDVLMLQSLQVALEKSVSLIYSVSIPIHENTYQHDHPQWDANKRKYSKIMNTADTKEREQCVCVTVCV